jgi:glycosyltransferase involved in cell wall biosynthesis
MPPTFSVVIPTYNRPEWLRAAIESVLAQRFDDFEVVVVDDGGTATLDLPDDPRVRLLRQDVNTGLSGAMNTGLAAARGDYVTFLDDDDLYTPDRLSIAVPALGTAGVAVCWSQVIGAPPQAERMLEGRVYDTVLDTWAPPKGATVIARSAIPMFDVRYHALEDLDWWIKVSRELDVTTVAEVGYLIRQHREPRNLNGPAPRIKFGQMLLEEHHEYFETHHRAAALRWYSMGMIARQLGDYRFARRALLRSFRYRPTIKRLGHVALSMRRSTSSWEDVEPA